MREKKRAGDPAVCSVHWCHISTCFCICPLVPHLHLFLFLFARNTPACVRVDTLIPASTQFLKTVGRYRIPDALPFAELPSLFAD